MIKFEDVAHLYYGCTMYHRWSSPEENITQILEHEALKYGVNDWIPALRPLSDIKNDERMTIARIKQRKDVWLHAAERTRFLLKQGFDLFRLIESGQAIDKTKL